MIEALERKCCTKPISTDIFSLTYDWFQNTLSQNHIANLSEMLHAPQLSEAVALVRHISGAPKHTRPVARIIFWLSPRYLAQKMSQIQRCVLSSSQTIKQSNIKRNIKIIYKLSDCCGNMSDFSPPFNEGLFT